MKLPDSQTSDVVKKQPPPRLSNTYKFRPTIKAAKIWDNSTQKPESKSLSGEGSESGSTSSTASKKTKPERPKEGEGLEKWTVAKFEAMDKHFKFDSKNSLYCSKCELILDGDPDQFTTCHDYPFHKACLVKLVGKFILPTFFSGILYFMFSNN